MAAHQHSRVEPTGEPADLLRRLTVMHGRLMFQECRDVEALIMAAL
jgi:hypothetical protein